MYTPAYVEHRRKHIKHECNATQDIRGQAKESRDEPGRRRKDQHIYALKPATYRASRPAGSNKQKTRIYLDLAARSLTPPKRKLNRRQPVWDVAVSITNKTTKARVDYCGNYL